MQRFSGEALSPGYAQGTVFVHGGPAMVEIPPVAIQSTQVADEIHRFENAVRKSVHELEKLRDQVLPELGEKEASIIETHLSLLKDPTFVDKVKGKVDKDLVNAEHAVDQQIRMMEGFLKDLKSEYLRDRTQDIRDVGRRVLKHLGLSTDKAVATLERLPRHSVIVATELYPSDTLQLDRRHVVGIVTEIGGSSSHASILARSMGIPSVTGIPKIASLVTTGDPILVDAQAGTVVLRPTRRSLDQFGRHKQQYEATVKTMIIEEKKACVTKDGERISLYGNIGRVEESQLVAEHHLTGVGLFRTEYLFLDSVNPPDLETQTQAYRKTTDILGKTPLVIRTLDLGGDKTPAFLAGDPSLRRSIGRRGLRFLLEERDLLLTQLRAIVRANRHGNIRVMFPMVLDAGDMQEAVALLQQAARRERVDTLPPVGAMIETPSAVFEIDNILRLVDFVSVGTNDLTQFILAADRDTAGTFDDHTVLHPGVVRAISRVVVATRARRRDLSVCGEAAGEPRVAGLLIGLGVRRLSMGPVRAAAVRHFIRTSRIDDLEKLAKNVLDAANSREIHALFARFGVHASSRAARG